MQKISHTLARRGLVRATLAVACSAALVAGCGGSTSPEEPAAPAGSSAPAGATSAAAELQTVNVGILPITSIVALAMGVEKGYFKEVGLDVKLNPAQGGAALVPAVMSGQYDFAFSNNASLMLGKAKGLDLRIVAAANSAGQEPDPVDEGLVAAPGSGITSISQLAGKTIGVNALNNIVQIADIAALEAAGVDPKTVKWLEVGFPDMPLALKEGRVDAADVAEPFLTKAKKEGAVPLGFPFRALQPVDFNISSWFTSGALVEKDPEMIAKFTAALDKSSKYANEHMDEVRDFVPTVLKIDEALAKEIYIPKWPLGLTNDGTLEAVHKALIARDLIKPDDLPDPKVLLYSAK